MSSYRRYYLPRVSWSDVKGGVWRIQPYNVTEYFFIFRVQNLLSSALPNRKLIGSKRVGEKIEEREKLPNRKLIGSKQDGEKVEEREKLPNRKLIGSKRVGEKIRETGKFPNWKTERRKLIGEKI